MNDPPQIQTREQRLDPFYQPPPLSDEQFSVGLYRLVNQGIIPKDYDLQPAFEKGMPPVKKQTVVLQPIENKSKFSKSMNSRKVNDFKNNMIDSLNSNTQNFSAFLTQENSSKIYKLNQY